MSGTEIGSQTGAGHLSGGISRRATCASSIRSPPSGHISASSGRGGTSCLGLGTATPCHGRRRQAAKATYGGSQEALLYGPPVVSMGTVSVVDSRTVIYWRGRGYSRRPSATTVSRSGNGCRVSGRVFSGPSSTTRPAFEHGSALAEVSVSRLDGRPRSAAITRGNGGSALVSPELSRRVCPCAG